MFSHPLLVCSSDADPMASVAVCRALSTTATELRVLVCVPPVFGLWASADDLVRVEGDLTAADAILGALRDACAGRLRVHGDITTDAPRAAIDALLGRDEPETVGAIDVVVFGPLGVSSADGLAELAHDVALTHGVATVTGVFREGRAARASSFLCPFDGTAAAVASIGAFFRNRGRDGQTLTLLALAAPDPRLLVARAAVDEIAGIRAALQTRTMEGGWLAAARGLDAIADEMGADVVTLSAALGSGVLDVVARRAIRAIAHGERPLLFVPQVAGAHVDRPGALDAFDAIAFPDAARAPVRLERAGLFGRPAPDEDEPIDVVSFGRRIETQSSLGGHVRLPRGSFGLGGAAGGDPLAALETTCAVIAPPTGPVALLDAGLDPAAMNAIHAGIYGTSGLGPRTILLVRTEPSESARDLRARWIAHGFEGVRLLDVRDLLDEGVADDVPAEAAGVRLARAAGRLRARGVDVDVVVARPTASARGLGFVVVTPNELEGLAARIAREHRPLDASPRTGLGRSGLGAHELGLRLDAMTDAPLVAGNEVTLHLDNAAARRALVALIEGATQRLNAQWYIVEDDEVSREIEAALVRAASRGVEVRVLVDSLYSLHGSFGAESALLGRLAAVPGVRLHASRPIAGVPSLVDLKQRDHRKIVTADGERSIVGGRNLALNYYRSFAEAQLSPTSPAASVPWLDASALVRGPAVRHLERSFLGAFVDAGGDEFPVVEPSPAGDVRLRVIVHRGLQDAYSLEAYLALIDTARERLVVVNSFPLQLELQHALLRAIARGVHLSLLVGRVRPAFGVTPTPFAGGSIRAVADALVRARLSALVEAGADVRELCLPAHPSWDPSLVALRPNVHAKLVVADGERFAIGSANLDVTAGYWESEALLVIEDHAQTKRLEDELRTLVDPSPKIDPKDPDWRAGAGFRDLLGRIWPSVVG